MNTPKDTATPRVPCVDHDIDSSPYPRGGTYIGLHRKPEPLPRTKPETRE